MVSMESRHHELTAAATREAVRELDQLNHGRYHVSFVMRTYTDDAHMSPAVSCEIRLTHEANCKL